MPFTDDVTRRLEPPREFSARKAVTLGNAKGGGLPDPKIFMELHANWGAGVSTTFQEGFGGLGWGKHASGELRGSSDGTL